MREWDYAVTLDPRAARPLFLQVADAIAADIRAGRLVQGQTLPGTRTLGVRLGLNRNTIVAAYEELAAQGSVRARNGGGTFVAASPRLSRVRPVEGAEFPDPTYALPEWDAPLSAPAQVVPVAALSLANGLPDRRLFPARALARAFRRAIDDRTRRVSDGASACGHARLRDALAHMLSHARGIPATAENVMVARGIELGIDLVARALLRPGDVVAVESLGYPPAWNALRLAGARLVPLPLDAEGLCVDALEDLLAHTPVRAVFLTPHHQFPTSAVMSATRRSRLGELARNERFAIIEDDYDHEFHYHGRPVLPLAGGKARSNVVYVGSLASLLAPGVGTAFVVAPPPVFERIAAMRSATDPRSDAAIECAIAEMFEDGELPRHARRLRRTCASRRDALADALHRRLRGAVEFTLPSGGLAIWTHVDPCIDLERWCGEGAREGVVFEGARRFDFSRRHHAAMRLAFSALDEREIDEAVARMARALRRSRDASAARRAPGDRATPAIASA